MKTIISITVFLWVSISVLWGQEIKTKIVDVENYNRIEVSSSLDVELIADGKEGVSIRCDEWLLPAIKVIKSGTLLEIGLDRKILKKITGRRWIKNVSISKDKVKINGMVFNGGISVVAHVKEIREITASSSGDVWWTGQLPTNRLQLNASSSGDISWEGMLTAEELRINCSSSGDVSGNFEGQKAVFDLSSSGDFEGNVTADVLKVDLSSSADFESAIQVQEATFELSSSGDAHVSGTVDFLNVQADSSADFYGKNLAYKQAEVKTSSSANIYLSKSGKVIDKTSKRTGVFIE